MVWVGLTFDALVAVGAASISSSLVVHLAQAARSERFPASVDLTGTLCHVDLLRRSATTPAVSAARGHSFRLSTGAGVTLSRERCSLDHALRLTSLGLRLGCVTRHTEPLQVRQPMVVVVVDVVTLGTDTSAVRLVGDSFTSSMSASLDLGYASRPVGRQS